ncbi:D-alanyl-D-alanine carboxypeptidase [Streptomyces erythrochromogenes]|uniref:D-alanyl-D-alanine carboxypeptidase n=1 Tax=Streptomyces erythrochromogenes TaxID=285574 RepID=UPI0036787C08
MTDGSSDDPKNEGTTVAGAEPEKAASASADTTAEAGTADGTEDRPERDAESATQTGAEPEPVAGAGAETAARTEAEADPRAETQTKAGAGAPTATQNAVEAGTQTKAETRADAGAEPQPETAAPTKAEAGDQAGAATATQNADEAAAQTRAMTGAQDQAGAAAQTEAEAGAEARPQPETAAPTEAGAKTQAGAGATTQNAGEAAGQTKAENRAGAATQTEAEGSTEAKDQAGAATQTKAEADTETGAQTKAVPGAQSPGRTETGTQGLAKSVPGATQDKTGAGTETGAGAGDQGQAKAVSGDQGRTEAKTQAGAETATQTAAENRAQAGTGAEAQGKTGPETGAGDQGQTKAVSGAQTKTQAGTGAEARGQAGADDPRGGDPRGLVGRAPRVTAPDDEADGPDTEPGADASHTQVLRVPPAPGPKSADEADASRTQVLRVPRTPAPDGKKPEPEPETESRADDSRTQVLRVPGPGATAPDGKTADKPGAPGKKTAEGAPKVPSWAAAREEDADPDPERTSRFVALKDLDAPAPVTTRPRPQPQPHTRPQPPAQTAAQAAPPQPLPPLDLLADLTNTPPPPETPRRTVLRRVKVWTPILLLLVGACIGGQMLRPLPDPRLVAAETDHTVDGQLSIPWPAKGQGAVRVVGSGDIGTFGDQKPVPTASVAKIMTAYVILKGHPLRKTEPGPDITVDAKTVADGNSASESRITGLTVGSKFSQQDMLKMLMIPSGNNVARLLARWDAGTDSEAAFVEKMNAAARELGMKDTVYTDPSGLDAGTVSTATDQLKLAEAVMKDETFRAIVALPEAPIKGLAEKLTNNNDLLTVQGLSIRGIKTGSSTPAGGTFVWAAYKSVGDETPLIIGSLMEQRAPAPDKDALNSLALVKANSKKIIEAVRAALASTPLVRKGDVVGYVDDGLGGRTPLVAVKDLNVISVPGQQFKLSLKAGSSPLPHTAKDGTEVGVLTAGEGEGAKSIPVAVKGALAEPSFGTRLTRLG